MTTGLKTHRCRRCKMPFLTVIERVEFMGKVFNWSEITCETCRKAAQGREKGKKAK